LYLTALKHNIENVFNKPWKNWQIFNNTPSDYAYIDGKALMRKYNIFMKVLSKKRILKTDVEFNIQHSMKTI
jgi:hypothetical protein